MNDTRLRYAVVGLGHIAQVAVLPSFANVAKSSELVALVSSDGAKLSELGRRYGVEHTGSYDDLEQVMRDARVQAVYLAVPNSEHRVFTERAARAGVHVLCEKPMALDEADCEAMIRATQAARVRLMIAYRLHFDEANLRAIETAQSGVIGEPRIFTAVFSEQVRAGDIRTRPELGGGALFDVGIYCVNAARNAFGEEPSEVCAYQAIGGEERFCNVDATTLAILRFSDDRMAQVASSLGAADASSYRIVGTRGDLRVEPAFDYHVELKHHLTVEGQLTVRTFPKHDHFGAQIDYFSRCIREGLKPEPSGEEGLFDVRVMRGIIASAKTGKSVTLETVQRTVRPSMRQQIFMPPIAPPSPVHATAPTT